ncbi:unnamed protein product [Cyprideis torosa]|uniref:Uncharacterized protein n=1 Tax=Cyprideis torosa TaxID=163714 RepID=A0A7R8ZLK9_9CRUS|nr:unnamed protein product [Cyprideis torosa]CAG0886918.1 unnamed protein product [Cyprideis torosa]
MTSMEEAQLRAKEEAAKQAGGGPRSESQAPPPPQQPTPPTPSPPPPSGGKLDPAKSKETLKDAKKDDKRDKRDKHDEHDDDEHHAHVPGQSAMEMASSGAAKAALKPKTTAVRPGSAMRSSAAARSGATGLKTTHAVRHVQAVRAAGITRIKTFVDEGKLAKDRKSLQSEPSPSEDESYDNETKQNKSKKGGRAEKPEDTSVAGELDEEELGSGDEFFEKSKNTDEEQEEEELFLEETHKNFDDDIGEDYDNSSIGTVECSNEMLGYDNHFSDPVDCSVIIVQSTSDRFNDPRSLDDEVQDVYREPETGDAENGVGLLSLYQCLWNLWISEHPFLRGFVTGFMSFGVILFCTTWMSTGGGA